MWANKGDFKCEESLNFTDLSIFFLVHCFLRHVLNTFCAHYFDANIAISASFTRKTTFKKLKINCESAFAKRAKFSKILTSKQMNFAFCQNHLIVQNSMEISPLQSDDALDLNVDDTKLVHRIPIKNADRGYWHPFQLDNWTLDFGALRFFFREKKENERQGNSFK